MPMFFSSKSILENLETEEYISKAENIITFGENKEIILSGAFWDLILRLGKIMQRDISGTSVETPLLHGTRFVTNNSCTGGGLSRVMHLYSVISHSFG